MDRAEQHFIEALLQLMQEKDYEKIKITELTEKAEYDRKTFYRRFGSKEKLLEIYCIYLLEEMTAQMQLAEPLTTQSGFLSYFRFWETHLDFLELLKKNRLLSYLGDLQARLLYTHVGLAVQSDLPDTLEDTPPLSQISYYFTLGGLWNVVVYWAGSGRQLTPEELTGYAILCMSGLSGEFAAKS